MTRHPLPAARRRVCLPVRRALTGAALTLLVPLLAGLSACVVTPVGYRSSTPPPGAYLDPAYPSPGADWMWQVHPIHGGGWRHPRDGWHRGWDREPR